MAENSPLLAKPVLENAPVVSPIPTRELIYEALVAWLRKADYPCDGVDYDTSLFDLGVDSLGVAEIAAHVEAATNKSLDPEEVYELETINELADYVDSLRPGARREAAPAPQRIPVQVVESPVASGDPGDPIDHFRRLNRRVNAIKEQGLYFFEPVITSHDGVWVDVDGRRMLMLSSYGYLGLLGHSRLKASAVAATKEFGTGHHGARLLAGTTSVHMQLEARIAEFMDAADSLVFSSGYVTNLATISALVGPDDCVIGDAWNHASIVDGCRMSGAEFQEFAHNDMTSLAERLGSSRGRRTLVVIDAVYSMEGDIANVPAIVELCRAHNAILMVDEAHSLGVLGRSGRGVQEHFDLAPNDIDIKMGTLSKSLASSGGFVAGREEIITYLRHHARGYIFSGALPAAQAAASLAALEVLEQQPELVDRLRANQQRYLEGLRGLGFDTGLSTTPIVPIMTHNNDRTLAMTRACREEGLFVVPVCYPAVPMDAPRLRTCMTALHTADDIDLALDILSRTARQCGLIG